NTFYNEDRLMGETEDDFAYQDENKRIKPRLFVPQSPNYIPAISKTGPPPFMEEFVINDQKMQPVKVKLDSIVIKGSKILARHPKSNYIEGSLYLMAKSFFYRRDWINSQIKTSELIDKFPDGDLSPDAHILMAKNYIIQRKFEAGKLILSRTVDVAWLKKRYDILSEAFRIEAELALFQNDPDGALRPYLQAIAQCDDNSVKAKWQIDLAGLYYRMNRFDKAEKMFAKVHDYSPDYLGTFEAYLYQSSCLSRLGKYDEAKQILEMLDNDGKFKEWKANVFAEKLNLIRLEKNDSLFKIQEKLADSLYPNNDAIAVVYFERGIEYFKDNRYLDARNYFARSRLQRTPVMNTSANLFKLINIWEGRRNSSLPLLQRIAKKETIDDSTYSKLSLYLFELGRVHEQFGNNDSAKFYYSKATEFAPPSFIESARFYYAYARFIELQNPDLADSLLDLVANNYPLTEYGRESQKKLGYTSAFYIDTVAELFNSGAALRKNGEYPFALIQFSKIFNNYPDAKLAPKALYSTGYTFEKNLKNYDSSMYYYMMLIQRYPTSEYAMDIRPTLDVTQEIRNGKPVPDSLKFAKLVKFVSMKDSIIKGVPIKTDKNKTLQQKTNPLDIIKNPGAIIDQVLEPFKNPGEKVESAIESVTNPNKIKSQLTPEIKINNPLQDLMDKPKTQDSTNTIKPKPPK
ncbi:MAG: tetratricopeptide repeat protein, partial [Bacteroidota bacterium]